MSLFGFGADDDRTYDAVVFPLPSGRRAPVDSSADLVPAAPGEARRPGQATDQTPSGMPAGVEAWRGLSQAPDHRR